MIEYNRQMELPSLDEFKKGREEFKKRESRDAMYKVATFLLLHFWGKPHDMADGLGVLLLTWNQAFYRYGPFDFDALEACIVANLDVIQRFRSREIFDFAKEDESEIKKLFNAFSDALKITEGKNQNHRSPVAVVKTLHLLAPKFFPLWDKEIANRYGCNYSKNPTEQYVRFCWLMKNFAERARNLVTDGEKSVVKAIDEFNYAKYTKHWI